MKSIRLSKELRNEIISSIADAYDANNPFPESLENSFALWCYEKIHGGIEKKIANLDPRYFTKCTSITVAFMGEQHSFTLPEAKIMFPSIYGRFSTNLQHHFDSKPREYLDYLAREQERDEYRQTRNKFLREVRSLVESVNSTKQLLEIWPEAEDYIPAHLADPSKGVKLPALQTSRLNERLGLCK